RAAGAFANRDLFGVALNVMHLIGIEAEPVADELFIDRLMTHAWVIEPDKSVTVPPRSKRNSAASNPPAAARSIVFDRPRPRNLPRSRDSARRRSNPATSASSNARSRFFANSPQS